MLNTCNKKGYDMSRCRVSRHIGPDSSILARGPSTCIALPDISARITPISPRPDSFTLSRGPIWSYPGRYAWQRDTRHVITSKYCPREVKFQSRIKHAVYCIRPPILVCVYVRDRAWFVRLYGEIIDRTGAQTMLYLTCTTITRVDLAHYGVSRAKDWVSVDCGTNTY